MPLKVDVLVVGWDGCGGGLFAALPPLAFSHGKNVWSDKDVNASRR